MSKLSSLPNVGRVLEILLNAADVNTAEELRELGTKEAFTRIRRIDNSACIQMLYGLHGAIVGMKAEDLSKESKNELRQFLKSL